MAEQFNLPDIVIGHNNTFEFPIVDGDHQPKSATGNTLVFELRANPSDVDPAVSVTGGGIDLVPWNDVADAAVRVTVANSATMNMTTGALICAPGRYHWGLTVANIGLALAFGQVSLIVTGARPR